MSGIPPNKSPGKGGKSLEMMQKRMQAQTQQQVPPTGTVSAQIQSSSAPASTVIASSATATPSAAQQSQSQNQTAHRAKGKDFASLSARARVSTTSSGISPTSATTANPMSSVSAPQPGASTYSGNANSNAPPVGVGMGPPPGAVMAPSISTSGRSTSVTSSSGRGTSTAPLISHTPQNTAAPVASKPKGKDFSAMASRMHPPQSDAPSHSSPSQQQPSHQQPQMLPPSHAQQQMMQQPRSVPSHQQQSPYPQSQSRSHQHAQAANVYQQPQQQQPMTGATGAKASSQHRGQPMPSQPLQHKSGVKQSTLIQIQHQQKMQQQQQQQHQVPPSYAQSTAHPPPQMSSATEMEAARHEQLKAAARAAAGLPPLERPPSAASIAAPSQPAPTSVQRSNRGGVSGATPSSSHGHSQHRSNQGYNPAGSGAPQQQYQPRMDPTGILSASVNMGSMAPMGASPSPGGAGLNHTSSVQMNMSQHSTPAKARRSSSVTGAASAITVASSVGSGMAFSNAQSVHSSVIQAASASVTPMNSKSSRAKANIQTTQTVQPSPIERSLALLSKKSKSSAAASPQGFQIPLIGERVQDLVKSVDPSYVLDNQAEEQLLELADDFLEKICRQSVRVAKHRGSDVVDVRDVQLMLQTQWGIVIPGLGPLPSRKRSQITKARASISAAIPPVEQQSSIRQRLSAPPPLSSTSIGNDGTVPTPTPIFNASGTTLPPTSGTNSNKRPSTAGGGGSSNKKAKIDSSKQ